MNTVTADRACVALKTVQLCLHRLFENGKDIDNNPFDQNVAQTETITITQLRNIVLKRGLDLKQVWLDWKTLQNAVSSNPVLLLLENKNVVVALRPDRNSTDNIVASDPLYLNGQDFFLPRQVLEAAWNGDAIIVTEIPLTKNGWIRSFTAAFVVCAAVAAVGLIIFYPRYVGEEHTVFEVTGTQPSSEKLPLDIKTPSDIAPKVLIPFEEVQPGNPNSERAAPAVAPAPVSAPETHSLIPVAPNSEPLAVVSTPAAVPAPARTPEADALIPVAPNPEPAAVGSTPAAAPVPARTPEADAPLASVFEPRAVVSAPVPAPVPATTPEDALAPVAPGSELAPVVSTRAAAPSPARTPEMHALTPAPNSQPATVLSTPAAAPAPVSAPEMRALTPVTPNPEPLTVVSTPAATSAPARTPDADPLTPVVPNPEPAAVGSTPAAAPVPARTPEAGAPLAPVSEPRAVVSAPVPAPSPARTPEVDALAPAPNSQPATVLSTPAASPTPVSAPEMRAHPVARNPEPLAVVSTPAATPAPARTPDADPLTPVAPGPDVAQVPIASVAPPKSNKSINSAEIAALVAHGDALFGTGDLNSARLFYERAADGGYGQAALRLGESYDPAFLASNRIPDRGDAALAALWYRRAHELGVAVAETLLKALQH